MFISNVKVAIEDLNDDSIPEIMIWNENDGGSTGGQYARMFTFANHRIQMFGDGTCSTEKIPMSKTKAGDIIFWGRLNKEGLSSEEFPMVEYQIALTKAGFLVKDMVQYQASNEVSETNVPGKVDWKIVNSNGKIKEKYNELKQKGAAIKWSKWIKNQDKNVFNYIKQNL